MDLSADERTRLLEESRQKTLWDYNSRMKGAFEKGEARAYKKMGVPFQKIAVDTGLSVEEIGRL
ncbi:hypothetical protein AGMMS50267_12950 [Spirochaetia bacterium]|nr:hypothetical protein AGMMS50267_12950 [Spirochaetia bacterium]